ncbi:MAG: cupredoxin domain-containing protein [Actinomycetota bacterium]
MARFTVIMMLLLTACGGGSSESESTPSPTPQATVESSEPEEESPATEPECVDETITGNTEVTIAENDNAFSPKCVVVLGGQGLEIVNKGSSKHNFSIEGTDVDLDTESGDTTRTEALAGAVEPGTFEFFCKYHRALGMVGEITLTEAG